MKGLIDKGLNKLISKKLLVFIIATIFFAIKMLESDQWFLITMMYIGGVSIIDIVSKTIKNDSK